MSDLDFSHLSPQQLEVALATSSIPPPPGVVPNFVNPGNENTAALVGLSITLTLATTFLLLRIYVVFIKIKQPHLGDCKYSSLNVSERTACSDANVFQILCP